MFSDLSQTWFPPLSPLTQVRRSHLRYGIIETLHRDNTIIYSRTISSLTRQYSTHYKAVSRDHLNSVSIMVSWFLNIQGFTRKVVDLSWWLFINSDLRAERMTGERLAWGWMRCWEVVTMEWRLRNIPIINLNCRAPPGVGVPVGRPGEGAGVDGGFLTAQNLLEVISEPEHTRM